MGVGWIKGKGRGGRAERGASEPTVERGHEVARR